MKNIKTFSNIKTLLYTLNLLVLFIISVPANSINTNKTIYDFVLKSDYNYKLPTNATFKNMLTDTICGDSITDFDNNSYSTLLIGNQCWMGENLKTIHYPDGTAIPNVTNAKTWYTLLQINRAYCNYDNNPSNADIYGSLYTWNTALNISSTFDYSDSCVIQGICPTGWHIPNKDEYMELINYLGGESIAGGKLKETGNTHWLYPNTGATNSSGFSALPGGIRDYRGPFAGIEGYGLWWSYSVVDLNLWLLRMNYLTESVYFGDIGYKVNGYSVRCIKGDALPDVKTDTIVDITQSSATCISSVISDGGSTIIARGVCWNTTGSPTLSDSITIDGSGSGIFTSNITGLSPNTLYFVRAYVTNSIGTTYGDEKSFNEACMDPITDYDGNSYKIVQIGNQCWMAENLKTTHYASGISIQYRTSNTSWDALADNNTSAAYCYYNNDTATANTYGALYTWAAAMGDNAVSSNTSPSGVQGVCPNGWHLPSKLELQELGTFLSSYTSCKLKEKGNSHWNLPNIDATNSTNFTALPGGQRHFKGSFKNIGDRGYWWLATEKDFNINENSDHFAYCMVLCNYTYNILPYFTFYKSYGFSVRCVRD